MTAPWTAARSTCARSSAVDLSVPNLIKVSRTEPGHPVSSARARSRN
jgi:hypothetical protein